MSETLQLDPRLCRLRQQRLRDRLSESSLDRAIIVSHANIQYFTGFRPHRLMQAAMLLDIAGPCILSAPNERPECAASDEIVTYEAQWLATLRQEQHCEALRVLENHLKSNANLRVGVEFSAFGRHGSSLIGTATSCPTDIDSLIWQMRRHKDPDELAMIRRAIACTDAMYSTAREIIEPGISELEVFSRLQQSALQVAGEPLTATGNDYQCGSPGGPPRDRPARDGELYILDLGPCYRGYYADNCRTFAVNGHPTDEQLRAWEAIVAVLEMVEQTVRPGVSCRELYERAKAMLDEYKPDAFFHHLGHGFGLFPHEGPHLNPNWNDRFETGDCFTAEPGLYTEKLNAGIRLEQNYRVTTDGVERLTNFPLEL